MPRPAAEAIRPRVRTGTIKGHKLFHRRGDETLRKNYLIYSYAVGVSYK